MNRNIFFKAITDMQEFLPHLVLVGGWVPFVYQNYVWKNVVTKPHYTTDIDFGIGGISSKLPRQTIYGRLNSLGYREKHVNLGKLIPIVPMMPLKKTAIPVEFICDRSADLGNLQTLTGKEIFINRLENFQLLLSGPSKVAIPIKGKNISINIPLEHIFIFHKLLTFANRDSRSKMAKDLYYVYYMLRFSPNKKENMDACRKMPDWKIMRGTAKKYFKDASSEGILLIESEFGCDSLIVNFRKHVFEIFKEILG